MIHMTVEVMCWNGIHHCADHKNFEDSSQYELVEDGKYEVHVRHTVKGSHHVARFTILSAKGKHVWRNEPYDFSDINGYTFVPTTEGKNDPFVLQTFDMISTDTVEYAKPISMLKPLVDIHHEWIYSVAEEMEIYARTLLFQKHVGLAVNGDFIVIIGYTKKRIRMSIRWVGPQRKPGPYWPFPIRVPIRPEEISPSVTSYKVNLEDPREIISIVFAKNFV